MAQELPAFLKARLKARGIKVDDDEATEADNRGGLAESPEDAPLPAGWTEAMDNYRHTYYYNASLGKSSWTRPTSTDANVIGVMVANPAPKILPPGWKSAVDPKTNRTYYCNSSTKVTTWEPPLVAAQMKRSVMIVPVDNAVPARAIPTANNRKRQRAAPAGIDPMDPASYSDAPVGGWGAGLASQKELAGGSSGRPLPSPGDVLRQNAQAQQPSSETYDLQKSGLGEAD
jgi:polyglutamine-binding protein 1